MTRRIGQRVWERVGSVTPFVWALAVVAVVALVLRLWAAHRFAYVVGFQDGDQVDFIRLATRLHEGDGYGTETWRVPGYPAFLAVVLQVREIAGFVVPNRAAVGVAQAVVGSGSVVLTGLLGRRRGSPAVGLIAAAVVALWPALIYMTSVVMSETLFTFLLTGGITLLFWDEQPTPRQAWLGGAILGLAAMVRPTALTVIVVVIVWFATTVRPWRCSLLKIRAIGLGALIVMSPWILRNAIDFSVFLPSAGEGGFFLCVGNHPEVDPTASESDGYCDRRPSETATGYNDRLTANALRWMVENPDEQPGLIATRAMALWRTDTDALDELDSRNHDPRFSAQTESRLADIATGYWSAVRLVGIVGIGVMLGRRRTRGVALAFAATLVFPLVAFSTDRFHQAAAPLVGIGIGVAVVGAWCLARRFMSNRRHPTAGAAAAATPPRE